MKCTVYSAEHRQSRRELWKLTRNVGEKNSYKLRINRREPSTNNLIQVHLFMQLAYDRLLGSHHLLQIKN